MPNRNNRNTHSSNRPHAAHSHVQTHHSTSHPTAHHHDEHSTHHRHSNANHSSPVIRELHRPPRDYRTHPMEFGNRHHDEHSASANRHSTAHHSSPVIRELHRPVRNYSTHPMEIPHPQAKQSFSSRNQLGKLPSFNALWKAAHEVYPVGQGKDDDYILNLDANVIGGKVAFNLWKNPKTGKRIYENACAIRMSRILQKNGYRIPKAGFGKTSSGADGLWYLVLVADMIKYIETIWKNIPSIKLHNLRDDREIRGKTGLLIFTVDFGDASGHVTLWNKTTCYDKCYFQNNLDRNHPGNTVSEIRFWELH